MKKFFKALALVLALVLVIGAIPASAATSFSLKKDTKVLYLGGSKGLKEDGTQCGTTSKYRISRLINGFDAETMYLKLESSDKTIVKTKDSKRKVYGKGIGEATVTIFIYDKDSDALLDTLQPTIKVKKNATTIQFAVKDANGELVDPTKKFGVNVPYTVVLSRRDADGNITDTDQRVITCEDKNVEIVSANDYNTIYTVTFKKAGSFKLVASTVQSDIWNAPIISVPVDAVAGYDAVDAKQVALNAAAVTFDTDVAGLSAANFNAYYEINGTKVYPTAAQSVTCKDNVATVTFLSDFVPGLTYFIEYDGNVAGSFPAANVTADSVASIEIPAQEFTVGQVGSLSFKLLDKNGIDVKSLLGSTLMGILTFELEKADIDTYITSGYDPQVYIGTVGKSYSVKATYTWIDANGKEQKAEGSGVVASVAVTPYTMGQVSGLISNDGKDYVVDGKINAEAKALEHWALNDKNVELQIAVPFTKGSDTKLDSFDNATEYDSYTIMSANEAVVMIGDAVTDAAGKVVAYKLIANKEGSTSIIIYGVKGTTKTAIGAIGVKVEPARKETTFTVTPTKKTINSKYTTDSIEFTFDVKDQYGAAVADKTVNVELINTTSSTPTYTGLKSSNTGKLTVYGSNFAGKGVVNLKFTVADTSLAQTVVIDVGEEADAVVQMLKLSGTTLDTGVKGDTEQKTISVSLEGKTKSGYAIAGETIAFSGEVRKTRSASGSSALPYFFTVEKDGALLTKTDANFDGITFTNVVAGTSSVVTSKAVKLAAGAYTVTAYSEKESNGTIVVSQIGKQTFVVTDNQLKAEVTRNDCAEQLDDVTSATEIAKAFTIKFNGETVTGAVFESTPNGDKTTASVKTATFYVGNDTVGYQEVVATIGDIVRKKKS